MVLRKDKGKRLRKGNYSRYSDVNKPKQDITDSDDDDKTSNNDNDNYQSDSSIASDQSQVQILLF